MPVHRRKYVSDDEGAILIVIMLAAWVALANSLDNGDHRKIKR